MKRPILFRGKRLDNGEWVEGSPLYNALGMCYFVLGLSDNSETGIISLRYVRVDPETVGQWTGLRDKNGRGIFDGDIIECISSDGTPVRHYIKFCEERGYSAQYIIGGTWRGESNECGPIWQYYIDKHSKYVIGNIYDNAELLKTE